MALDSGKVKLRDQFDARFPIKFARFDIRDTHPQARFLSVPEVFMYSSNIGTVKIAETMGVQTQREYFKRLGFLSPVDVELPERGQPIFPEPWREIHMMTASFGHGIAVSPLHLVRATAAVVNGGTLPTLTLLKKKETTTVSGKQVLKPETSQAMRGLLRQVVMQGTGKSADVPGYQVGGKTGTAEKSHNGGYNRKAVLTTFVGSFPMNDPRYVTLMLLDEPQSTPQTHGYITAGWNVAPLTAELIERIAPMLGVMPEAPEKVQEVVYQGVKE
jgi:cell division protein FtsI (penicillin-binding protein 3)